MLHIVFVNVVKQVFTLASYTTVRLKLGPSLVLLTGQLLRAFSRPICLKSEYLTLLPGFSKNMLILLAYDIQKKRLTGEILLVIFTNNSMQIS